MNIGKNLFVIFLIIIVSVFAVEIFSMFKESRSLAGDNQKLMAQLQSLTDEKNKIQEDINYYSNAANLQKLLRQEFNYKQPGEKMIIVVPQQ